MRLGELTGELKSQNPDSPELRTPLSKTPFQGFVHLGGTLFRYSQEAEDVNSLSQTKMLLDSVFWEEVGCLGKDTPLPDETEPLPF